ARVGRARGRLPAAPAAAARDGRGHRARLRPRPTPGLRPPAAGVQARVPERRLEPPARPVHAVGAAARVRGRHRPGVRAEQLPPHRPRLGGAGRVGRAAHRRPPRGDLPLRRHAAADPGPERALPEVGMIAWPPVELMTDEYQLAMADSYLAQGKADGEVAFELFVRALPPERGFLVAAGLERVCEYLTSFRFGTEAVNYLRRSRTVSDPLLRHLASLRFEGGVDAVPEGTVVHAGEPLVRVEGGRLVCQL